MNQTAGKIIIDGNAACGMGAVFAGVTVVAWYPITPSTSVIEATTDLLKKFRVTPEGKATFAVVQAEDELAAIGMVLGAGWAGARSMTSTSGPGISLMAEFSGLGYYAEIPGVIFDVQRTGPSTGMPTRTSQADLLSAAFLSHGDTKHIVLLPGSVKECFEFGYAAFDLAERLQTPVFVLTDLDLGMNNWMSEPFDYPDKPLDRGKVLTAEDLNRLGGFARYRDVDGDAIGWRTLPGTPHPKAAYFTRGSGHNDAAGYTEKPDEYLEVMERLARKFENARKLVPAPVVGQERHLEDWLPRLRQHRLRAPREPRPDQEGIRAQTSTTCASAPIPSRTRFTTSSPRTSASTWSNRIATRSWPACSSSTFPPIRWSSCAAFSTTTDCRSTPAPSPKNSRPRRASKWQPQPHSTQSQSHRPSHP